MGLSNVMCNALVQTVVQAHAPSEIRGRIMGVYQQRDLAVTTGSMLIGARVSERQARGQIFIPFHFREAAANLLTNPRLDPYAKIAEFKISAVKVEPVREPVFAD